MHPSVPVRVAIAACALGVFCSCSSQRPDSPMESARQQTSAVIGGVPDNDAQAHDAVVLLRHVNNLCSGTLIAPNLVVTARHCVSTTLTSTIACSSNGTSANGAHVGADFDPHDIRVYTGYKPTFYGGAEPAARGLTVFHEQTSILCNHDIALIQLDQDVTGVTIPKIRLDYGIQRLEKVMVIGYGHTDASGSSPVGIRYRRANVPVVSSGRDWNFFTSAGEFVLGQSTCKGDSGGPALAMDTSAVVGITSRGGDCQTGHQTFTRLDAHKPLIEQALKAAGHSALLDTSSPPPASSEKATGDGPCDTGSQCSMDMCFVPKNVSSPDAGTSDAAAPSDGTYCSIFSCHTQQCPGDMVCAMAEQKGLTKPIPMCVHVQDGDACHTCRYGKCRDSVETCLMDVDCEKLYMCAENCTTPWCVDECRTKFPKGQTRFDSTEKCTCEYLCGSPCGKRCGLPEQDGGPQDGSLDAGATDAQQTPDSAAVGDAHVDEPDVPEPDAQQPKPDGGGGNDADDTGSEGGCSVGNAGGQRRGISWLLMLTALGLLVRRKDRDLSLH